MHETIIRCRIIYIRHNDNEESMVIVTASGASGISSGRVHVTRPSRAKNGRSGAIPIPGFVLLQKYCSPIRLQYFMWNIHSHLVSQHVMTAPIITIAIT